MGDNGGVTDARFVSITAIRRRLSSHVRSVLKGSTLVILDRGEPIARVVPFTGQPSPLVVRPATKTWAEIAPILALLMPVKLKTDSVDLLLEMRKDRF